MNYDKLSLILRLIMADALDLDYLDNKIDNWEEMGMITKKDAAWLRSEMRVIVMLENPTRKFR